MATWKALLPGIVLCVSSISLLMWGVLTDKWFVIDATEYKRLCREEKTLEGLYPWTYLTNKQETDGIDDVAYSGDKKVTPDRSYRYDNAVETERLANDWPGFPQENKGKTHQPAPLLQRIFKIKSRVVINGDSNKQNPAQYVLTPGERLNNQEHKQRQKMKIAEWNQLMNDLSKNLIGFGGRDIALNRKEHTNPSGARNNECVNVLKKSMKDKGENTHRCLNIKAGDMKNEKPFSNCRKRQFSTYTGLWQTCFALEKDTLLSKIITEGNLTRCSPVRYADLKTGNLPAGLSKEEIEEVHADEWKTLHLRRILTSFLCMGASMQVFGLILVVIGWITCRGYVVYSGGLVLVMSGVFQLLAIGTSIILFDVELNRTPSDIYRFPDGVREEFGRSAQALWISTVSALLAGTLCAMAPVYFHSSSRLPLPQVNGNITPQIVRPEVPLVALENKHEHENKVDVIVRVQTETEYNKPYLKKQAYSTDTYKKTNVNYEKTAKMGNLKSEKKTLSVPNLSHEELKHSVSRSLRGRSSSCRRSRTRALSPLAVVRTPKAALLALENENNSDTEKNESDLDNIPMSPRHKIVKPRRRSESVDDKMFGKSNIASGTSGNFPHAYSLNMAYRLYDSKMDLSCLTSVEFSQKLRHARYARRTSHSHGEAAAKLRNLLQDTSSEERRTQSLPRPTMRHTLLSEITGLGGEMALQEHRQCILRRQYRLSAESDNFVCSHQPNLLSSIGRHHSEDTSQIIKQRPLHPSVARWLRDGGRWSQSLDESGESSVGNMKKDFHHYSFVGPSISREMTLDSVEESEEVISPEEDKKSKR